MSSLFSRLVDYFGLVEVTMWAVSVISTLTERLILFGICAGFLVVTGRMSRRFVEARKRVAFRAAYAFVCFAVLFLVFPFSEYPFAVSNYLFPGDHPFLAAMALAFIAGAFAAWKINRIWLPAITVSLGAVILLNGWALRGFARRLHANPAVQQFARGDFNWIELSGPLQTLYAVGHGTQHLQAFDTNAIDRKPRLSASDTGGAQAFAFNPSDRELYVVNLATQVLQIVDAESMALKKEYGQIGISPADVFMSWDDKTGSIFIAAEEANDGAPSVLVNRQSGKVQPLDFGAFNVYGDPRRSRLYLNLEAEKELAIYDLSTRRFTARMPVAGHYVERVVARRDRNEVLVAMPIERSVWRLDADTLAKKGSFPALAGVRTLAVDESRGLLFVGSLIVSTLEIIDLQTERRVAAFYVGPWMRTIALDPKVGVAYVSTIEGLFRVNYGPSVRKPTG